MNTKPMNPHDFYGVPVTSGIYFYGETGTGKTELVCSFAMDALLRKVNFKFVSVPSLLAEIKDSYRKDSDTNEADIMDRYISCEWLFLDDLGTEKTTEWVLQTLYQIIDARYREMRPLFVTSNYTINQISALLHERIASRLRASCVELEHKGPDRRHK